MALTGLLLLGGTGASLVASTVQNRRAPGGKADGPRDLPKYEANYFTGSGYCAECHTTDGFVLMDSEGNDVSMTTDWRSTMMANSFKDPFFQATIAREVALRPAEQVEIEDLCLKCHAPMGRTEAVLNGAAHLSLAEAKLSQVAREGVSCTLCHQVQPDNLGTPASWNGGYHITDAREIFGPYDGVYEWAMITGVRFTPKFGAHMLTSEHCATCHTLFTPVRDAENNVIGQFAEQTPYLEWKNSEFASPLSENAKTCQECHMPVLEEEIYIAHDPPIQGRSPFFRHHFVGGNTFMLKMLRDNIDQLGVTAEESQFDTTIARARTQLQNRTAFLSIVRGEANGGTAEVEVRLENLAGHKFPTGYPARRAWIHFVARDVSDNILFESGAWDADGNITLPAEGYHPHYQTIDSSAKVQVYEGVMQDITGARTTSLLAAADYLKDNRLPPRGFVSDGPYYTDTAIIGDAASDADFNIENGVEGSGTDRVVFRFPISVAPENVRIEAELVYQSVNPAYVSHLQAPATTAGQAFLDLYAEQTNAPELIARRQSPLLLTTDSWMMY